jgi:hypothetical protein
MSYMGYYFYPDAMESIDEEASEKKVLRAPRSKERTILSLLTITLLILVILII